MVIPLDQKSSGSSPDGATKKALLRAFFVATVGSLHATILHATALHPFQWIIFNIFPDPCQLSGCTDNGIIKP